MTETINPLLARKNKLPGETFRLPSRGLFYSNGELDKEVKDGEIVLFPMTTQDDIYMKSPDMLYQGTALEKVIGRCCPQVKNPMELLSIDIDYILTCLRKISYGKYIQLKYNHKCKEGTEDRDYNIAIDHFILNSKEITPEHFDKFTITVRTGEVVKIKPPTFAEILKLQQTNTDALEKEKFIDYIFDQVCALIEKVDTTTEKHFINEWLRASEIDVMEDIKNKISDISQWGPEFKYTIKCTDCKKNVELTTPLNPVAFFILPSSPKTQKD